MFDLALAAPLHEKVSDINDPEDILAVGRLNRLKHYKEHVVGEVRNISFLLSGAWLQDGAESNFQTLLCLAVDRRESDSPIIIIIY